MTNILPPLQKKLPVDFVEIFRNVSLVTLSLGIDSFLIGAIVRDLIFEYVYEANIRRKTEDIDFGIAVSSWDEYKQLRNALIETKRFRNDAKQEQRVWWIGGAIEIRVDLVPYGGIASQNAEIQFPPDGSFSMSTLGFREVADNLIILRVDDFEIRMASLPGLALLKFVAYNDRPNERQRDVQDIWFMGWNYMNAGNGDRLYSTDSDLLDENFDYRIVGARLLGRDIASLLNEDTNRIIVNTLGEKSGALCRFADVINRDRLGDEDYEQILNALRQLKKGIEERT